MLVLQALLVTLAVNPPLAVAPRTPPASANPAAQVVAVLGPVAAKAGAKEFTLARGTLLDRTDVLQVPDERWVLLVLLHNRQLVRLDGDMSAAVEKLALFKAPETTEDAEAVLNRMLTRKERQALGTERLIGWHQGQVGANALAATSAEKRKEASDAPGGIKPAAPPAPIGGASPAGPAGAPPAAPAKDARPSAEPPPPQRARQEESKRDEPTKTAKGGGGHHGQAKRNVLDDALLQGEAAEAKPVQPASSAPGVAPTLVVDGRLTACVEQAAEAAGPEAKRALGGKVVLLLRLRDGEVQVSTRGALPVDACLVTWATAQKARLTPTWAELTVPLK